MLGASVCQLDSRSGTCVHTRTLSILHSTFASAKYTMPREADMKGGVDNYRSTSLERPCGFTMATSRLGLICFKARATASADALSRNGPRLSPLTVTHQIGTFPSSVIVASPCPVRVPLRGRVLVNGDSPAVSAVPASAARATFHPSPCLCTPPSTVLLTVPTTVSTLTMPAIPTFPPPFARLLGRDLNISIVGNPSSRQRDR
jgi:hypothetical protein